MFTSHAAARPGYGLRHLASSLLAVAVSFLPETSSFADHLVAQEPSSADEAPVDAPLWHGLGAGPHAVGFRVDWLVDEVRSGPGSSEGDGRLLRVYTWYPAVAGTGEAMTFGDYLSPRPPDGTRWTTIVAYLDQRDASTFARQFSPPSDSASERLRGTPVPARRDAAIDEGRFPLVLHSLGRNDYQVECSVLWEYLASHGYFVSVVPQLGIGNDSPTLAFEPADMELQAIDLAFALREIGGWPRVDDGSVGLIGHSSGGIAGLLLAHREPRVDAIVGLDASFGTTEGQTLLTAMGDPHSSVDVALLDLHARASRSRDTAVIAAMASSDRWSIAFGGTSPPKIATHFDFQNWPLYANLLGVEDERAAGARPASWASDVSLSAVQLTRAFLDQHLRNGAGTWQPELTALLLDSSDVRVRIRPAEGGGLLPTSTARPPIDGGEPRARQMIDGEPRSCFRKGRPAGVPAPERAAERDSAPAILRELHEPTVNGARGEDHGPRAVLARRPRLASHGFRNRLFRFIVENHCRASTRAVTGVGRTGVGER